jgi:2-oxoisovalerate dehydrogenase E2 component (dihydrolipoyl transacylase)
VPRLVGSKMTATKIVINGLNNFEMNVSFGCDHRILDGATVTRFTNKWKSFIEDPNLMALSMK